MKIQSINVATILAAIVATVGAVATARGANAFSDNLTGTASTVGGASVPSGGKTTSYDIASAKDSNADVISTSGLGLTLPVSTSAIVEAQAIFTTKPITLTNVGDNIDLTVTFIATAGTPIALYFGLFDSGGVAPLTSLANGGLSSALNTAATGGAQNYLGYVANLQNNVGGTRSKLQTRPAQTGTSNTNQDLVSAGASPSQSFQGTTQLGVASTVTSSLPVSSGGTYTEDLLITVTAAAGGTTPIQYSLDSNLYSGTTATGTALITIHGTDPTTTPAAFGYNGFDSFAFGYRETNSVAAEIDYTNVTVASNTITAQLLNGDANGDGKVDSTDLTIVLNHLGATSSNRSDGNFDGATTIDLNDLNAVLNNLGTSLTPGLATDVASAEASFSPATAAPEPSSLLLLGAGLSLLLTIGRKRRVAAAIVAR